MLRVVDGYGREIFVTRQQWRDNILVNNIKQQWDNPDALFSIIVSSLEDGFLSDVIDAARHLHEIDPIPLRGANIYGVVLMEEGRLDEAEQVFQNYLKQHEEAGIVFVNLAKIAAKRGDTAKADEFLWKGLQLDPNQDHGFMWYMSKQKESGTPTAEEDALRRIAALPQSWRAQLWLARKALDQRDLDAAMSLYQESLSRAGSPVPGDLLMQMSGDLGNRAHLLELVQLLDPNFNARFHGMQVGNNLIKAHIDLGQLEEAARILNELHAMKRPDWGPALSFWDSQLAKARISTAPQATPEEMQITLLTIEGPAVWLKSTSPATELFPVETKSGSVVAFVGGSAEQPSKEGEAGMQAKLSDWLGRLTRAIPLYLSEQIAFSTASDVRTLIPWMIEPTEAFVVLGHPIPDEAAAGQARDAAKPAD